MKEAFIEKNFGVVRLEMIGQVNAILADYARQGYRLSLRQLYYQLVARAIIENTLHSYKAGPCPRCVWIPPLPERERAG